MKVRKLKEIIINRKDLKKNINEKSLKEILNLHEKWLNCEDGGEKANLSNADLSNADLKNLDLRYADLSNTNLVNADLSNTNLVNADLSNVNLSNADLKNSDLRYADLSNADLSNANLSDANLKNADLRYADLRYSNLRYASLENANLKYVDLRYADLIYSDLIYADLRYSNLRNTNLTYADLRYADLKNADLRFSNLSNTNLNDTNLSNVNLRYTDLNNTKYNHLTSFFALQCPEKGSFIAYKKALSIENNNEVEVIVELLVMEDSERSSATSRKCRFSHTKTLSITSLDGKINYSIAHSMKYSDFIYEVGKENTVDDFDKNRWNECSTGIHGFITREEAVNYLK